MSSKTGSASKIKMEKVKGIWKKQRAYTCNGAVDFNGRKAEGKKIHYEIRQDRQVFFRQLFQ